MNKLLHILGIGILIILVGNLLFWTLLSVSFPPIVDLNNNGLVLKIKPYAFAFVHGNYADTVGYCADPIFEKADNGDNLLNRFNQTCIVYQGTTHYTQYNGYDIPTEEFVGDLYRQGYTYVWTTACQTGNHPYMSNYSIHINRYISIENLTYSTPSPQHTVMWPDWVSRNERPGKTIPIFVGLGFVRLSV